MKKVFIFAIFVVILTQIKCQTPYDPNATYNYTWLNNVQYNMDKLQLCAVPSADKTHCEKCINDKLSVIYLGAGVYTFCQLDWPVDNCYAYDFCVNCMLCHDGYWLNQTVNDINYCVPKTRGCLKYDSVNKKCVTCMDSWVMNTTVNRYSSLTEYYCMFVPDKNCLQYDNNNTCQKCASNYVLTGNKCVFMIANCDVMSGNTCTKCKTNYQLDSTGNCVAIPKITNCQLQVDYTCQSCVTGYKLQSNQCVFIIDNCAKVSVTSCTQCNSGYYITVDGKCAVIPRVPNCQIQTDFICTKCSFGYYLDVDGKCALIPPIPNCEIQSDFVCTKCFSGYFFDADKKCTLIPPIAHCEAQSDFICTKCLHGYFIDAEKKCSMIPPISYCETQTDFICAKCQSGFYINSNGHCAQIPPIAHCEIQSDFTCTQCLAGYTLAENSCIVVIPNCMEITGTTCTKCNEGYEVAPSGQCSPIPKIKNCLLQIQYTCSQCVTGHDLISNTCVQHIENCKTVADTVCTQCNDGYVLGSNGKCTVFDPFANFDPNCRLYDNSVFNKCLQCSNGFFINSQGKCQQVDPLCKTYNSQNGLCLSCYVGFTLDSVHAKCVHSIIIPDSSSNLDNCYQYDFTQNICVKCSQGCYFDSTGKCQRYNDVNCKTASSDLKSCLQCYIGYAYDAAQGKCVTANYNCATWRNGKCETCPKGFYLDYNSNCTMIDPYCKLFNPVLKMCIMCYPGYRTDFDMKCKQIHLLPVKVQKYSENCASFNEKGQCIDCFYGYFVTKDTNGFYCQKVSDLCKGYSKNTGKCVSCYMGYYLKTDGSCERFF